MPAAEHRVHVGHDRDRDRRARPRAIVARTSGGRAPASSASRDASWITPPSITGSENGIPTSIASAPASSSARSSAGVDARQPAGHVRDERLRPPASRRARSAASSAPIRRASRARRRTVSRSLSPRPDRHTSTRAPGGERPRRAATRSRATARAPGGCPRCARAPGTPRAPRASVALTYRREPGVLQVRVLGPDARVVEPGRDRMRLDDLAVGVLQQVGERAVQHAGLALRERRAVLAELAARARPPRRRSARRPGAPDERGEHADRVRAAADAGERRRRDRRPSARRTARAPRRRSRAGSRAPAPGTGAARRPSR